MHAVRTSLARDDFANCVRIVCVYSIVYALNAFDCLFLALNFNSLSAFLVKNFETGSSLHSVHPFILWSHTMMDTYFVCTAAVLLSALVPMECMGPGAGKIRMITDDSDPILWSRARDVALILKGDVLSQINGNDFALLGDYTMYPFDLIECGVQV